MRELDEIVRVQGTGGSDDRQRGGLAGQRVAAGAAGRALEGGAGGAVRKVATAEILPVPDRQTDPMAADRS